MAGDENVYLAPRFAYFASNYASLAAWRHKAAEGSCHFCFFVWFIYPKSAHHHQVSQVRTATCERTIGHPTTAGLWVRTPPWFTVLFAFFCLFVKGICFAQLCARDWVLLSSKKWYYIILRIQIITTYNHNLELTIFFCKSKRDLNCVLRNSDFCCS